MSHLNPTAYSKGTLKTANALSNVAIAAVLIACLFMVIGLFSGSKSWGGAACIAYAVAFLAKTAETENLRALLPK